jgi:radical SAM-linked protein
MSESGLFRYRIEYSKAALMRFTGHLDMMRVWERTFRRAQLSLAYTQGFNPHPRINLGLALPLGYTSQCELMDIWLTEKIESNELFTKIRNVVPPGLEIQKVFEISLDAPTLQKQIQAATYVVYLDPVLPREKLQGKIDDLLASQEILRERRGKQYDLRPLIKSLEWMELEGENVITMCLSAQEGQTGRPDEVLLQLNLDPYVATIIRKQLIF